MILFKPYGHLTKTDAGEFRLSLVVLLPDDFDINHTTTEYLPGGSIVRIHLPMTAMPGQVHAAAKEFHLHVDNVADKHRIEAIVQTGIPSHKLPDYVQDLINDITKSPLELGKVVLCTEGVEEGDDDREGTTPDNKSKPIDNG